MNGKGYGRKRSWSNLRCYFGICLERLGINTKNLSQNSHSPGRNLKQSSPEYEAGILTTRQRCSAHSWLLVDTYIHRQDFTKCFIIEQGAKNKTFSPQQHTSVILEDSIHFILAQTVTTSQKKVNICYIDL
jgi:hypothetical protein